MGAGPNIDPARLALPEGGERARSDALRSLGRTLHAALLRIRSRELRPAVVVGTAFLVVAVPLAFVLPQVRPWSFPELLVLVGMYAAVSRIELQIGAGSVVPTQLVLVPMLFTLPARIVPLAVAAGYVLGNLVDHLRHGQHLERSFGMLASSWHALGPALVLALAGPVTPDWHDWPIFAGALAAQLAFDVAAAGAHNWLIHDRSRRFRFRDIRLAYAIDLVFTPVGFMAVASSDEVPWPFVLLLPLAWMFSILARERKARTEQEVELSQAYRGTAFLLGDVVEADDSYTGTHCRDVVDLVLAVVDELDLDRADRRRAEFAALLHDVGKIRIPNAIINKPGALTPEERRVVETHTIEGQALLERIGGLLGDVGLIVRSHHERWDGSGYPDGLRGEQIPLLSRVIAACDTFNAMTTDRPYRAALPVHTAMTELRRQAGAQFDPAVVEALERVLGRHRSLPAAPERAPLGRVA